MFFEVNSVRLRLVSAFMGAPIGVGAFLDPGSTNLFILRIRNGRSVEGSIAEVVLGRAWKEVWI